jgi:hypothetical protein
MKERTTKSNNGTQKSIFPLKDAQIAVAWLNAAKSERDLAPYQRVTKIRNRLADFCTLRTELQEPWVAFQRKLRTAGKGEAVQFPGLSAKNALHRRAVRLETEINRALAKYTFHPAVFYSVGFDTWQSGMISSHRPRLFLVEIVPGTIVSEAEAARSIVQLSLFGDLRKVQICRSCKDRWFVCAKKNYQFCSRECRERFYESDPKFLDRKAANQRTYRQNLKRLGL